MWEAIERFLSGRFMPHGHCYLWSPEMVWLQVISNLLIALAYMSISSTLYYIVRRIRDVPFSWMYLAFGVFIVTCGVTHFLDVVTIWHPVYWLDGGVRGVTAAASVGTAVLLFPLVPKAVALANAAQLAHERGQKLEATYKELETAHARMKEVERLKTDFFANVSHELRTPLALVLGPAEKLLEAHNLTAEQRADVDVIARNARTVLKHVNDLLDVAKVEAGRMHPSYARVDVSAMTMLAAGLFTSAARERKIDLRTDIEPEIVAEVDAEKIERVLLNVLGNALKFTPEGGIVRCALRRGEGGRGGVVHFEIADSGPGIPGEMRERVFERFAQIESGAARRFGGTGLGLAIAHEFVALHGGKIAVDEAPEGGARFTVELPARAPEGTQVSADQPTGARASVRERAALVDELVPADRGSTPAGEPGVEKNGTVLVVEDNREMNAFVAETLASEYFVERAFDGSEGLEKARRLLPDLVVTDVMMPETSGDVLVEALRASEDLRHIPIVVLSAKADDDLRIRLLGRGVEDYVMKPFAREELRARVRNLVRVKRAAEILQSELASREGDVVRLAEEARRKKRELEDALESVQIAREQAERASRAKTAFLAMVSHELRTPLSSMQLVVDRLAGLDGGPVKSVARLKIAVDRLTELVESLLEHARIQSGSLRIAPERIDLAGVVSGLVEEIRPQAEVKRLAVDTHVPAEAPLVSDPRLVRIVVANLLANAVKFTTHGGITVALDATDAELVLRVTDTGPGIDPADQARIFEPFEQLEPGRHKHIPGVGLGLALVRDIVQALHGTLRVDSQPGKGSTFEVRFRKAPETPP